MRKKLMFLLYSINFVYFSYALFNTTAGSLTIPIMDYFKIDTATRGFLILLQGFGGLSAVLLIMFFGERFNKLIIYMISIFLVSTSGIITALNNSLYLYAFLLFAGGCGMLGIDSLCNAIVSDTYKENQDKYIPYLHLTYGAGAVLSNVLIVFIIDRLDTESWKSVYLVFSLIGLIATAVICISLYTSKKYVLYNRIQSEDDKPKITDILKKKDTWKLFFSALLFASFYVAISTWLPYYWEKELLINKTLSTLAVSIFFTGVLVMRILSPVLLRRLTPQLIILAGSILGSICVALSLVVSSTAFTILLTAIAGIFIGGEFPLLALVSCRLFPNRTSFGSSMILLCITLAMLLIPWLTGIIANQISMFIALVFSIVCLVSSGPIVYMIKGKKTNPENKNNEGAL